MTAKRNRPPERSAIRIGLTPRQAAAGLGKRWEDDWRERRACGPRYNSSFFDEDYPIIAKRICGRCEVRGSCLAEGIATESQGIWGGLTTAERNRVARALELRPVSWR